MKKPLLAGAVHEIIDGLHPEAGMQQVFADDAAEVSQSPGDENPFGHVVHSSSLRMPAVNRPRRQIGRPERWATLFPRLIICPKEKSLSMHNCPFALVRSHVKKM